jgi:hypothetical protein
MTVASLISGMHSGWPGGRFTSITRREYPASTAGASSASAKARVTSAAPMS